MSEDFIKYAEEGFWKNVDLKRLAAMSKEQIEDLSMNADGTHRPHSFFELACIYGQVEIVKILLGKGINPDGYSKHYPKDIEPDNRHTPLLLALGAENIVDKPNLPSGNYEVAGLLLGAGANPNLDHEKNQIALLARLGFAKSQDAQLFKKMLEKGANPNLLDMGESSPLLALLFGAREAEPQQIRNYFKSFVLMLAKVDDLYSLRHNIQKAIYKHDNFANMFLFGAVTGLIGFGFPKVFKVAMQADSDIYIYTSLVDLVKPNVIRNDNPSYNNARFLLHMYEEKGFITCAEFVDHYYKLDSSLRNSFFEALHQTIANYTNSPDFVFADGNLVKAMVLNGQLKAVLEKASELGQDLSKALFSVDQERKQSIAYSIIEAGHVECFQYFVYWQKFPEKLPELINIAKEIKERKHDGKPEDAPVSERQYKELLNLRVNIQTAGKPASSDVFISGLAPQKQVINVRKL